MITDHQARKLMKLVQEGEPLSRAALKAGMNEKTARRYRSAGKLPSELQSPHTWRTRADPFAEVWDEVRTRLEAHPGLQAKTLFGDLQRRHPERWADGQLRTLQRKIKAWRALEGPAKEVFFPQQHHPAEIAASDFCQLTELGITLGRQPFPHLLYHFVLTYSNWETGSICFSESFESLSHGLQAALWELGGVPQRHRTDSLSAALHPLTQGNSPEVFTQRYQALLAHYGLSGERIRPSQAHENGDIEQRHYRFRTALDQALLLRGHRDFADRQEYERFLRDLFAQLNAGRKQRFTEERSLLRPLPKTRQDATRTLRLRVTRNSTLRVVNNTYSVHSRLIGERVEVRLGAEHLEVWYAQQCVERLPRVRGRAQHRIEYRHLIDWLVRKPGAFAHYCYRDALFPTSRFRMAYDAFAATRPATADREYLALLQLAAKETEQGVDDALRLLLGTGSLSVAAVTALVRSGQALPPPTAVQVGPVELHRYDSLLSGVSSNVEGC